MDEEWRSVVGYEGWYSVSSLGQVRRDMPGRRTQVGKLIRLSAYGGTRDARRLRVGLTNGSHASLRHFPVHRLVAEAFLGPRPAGMTINHIDGNSINNRADNIEYISGADNSAHGARLGLMAWGERNPKAALSEDAVIDILTSPLRQIDLAAKYGVLQTTISDVRTGRTWAHLAPHLPRRRSFRRT